MTYHVLLSCHLPCSTRAVYSDWYATFPPSQVCKSYSRLDLTSKRKKRPFSLRHSFFGGKTKVLSITAQAFLLENSFNKSFLKSAL